MGFDPGDQLKDLEEDVNNELFPDDEDEKADDDGDGDRDQPEEGRKDE